MKKLLLPLVFSLGFTAPLFAGPVGLGIRGGGVLSSVTGLPSYASYLHTDFVPGFGAGAFLEFGLNDFLSLQPEAGYIRKGFSENISGIYVIDPYGNIVGSADGTYTLHFDYLEFPLLVKAHKSLGPGVSGSLCMGPSLGILLGASEDYSSSSFGSGSAPVTGFSSTDFSWMFGAGIELGQFLLDLRYDLGLTGIEPNFSLSPKNSALSLQVGYRIL